MMIMEGSRMDTTSTQFFERPHTKLGWWAVGLAIARVPLMWGWMFLPGGALLSFLSGLAGSILALIAILRQKERSWAVCLALMPGLFTIFFFIGEFLFPH
jgi:hypothetical protein